MAIDAAVRGTAAPSAPPLPPHGPRVATTALGLVVATLAGGALAVGLAMRAFALVTETSARTVDSLVEVVVCGLGALVAGWLAASALLALGCLAARFVGSSWRLGERLVHRCAPAVVRRALVLVVGASVGLGAATGASAATSPTPTASTAVGLQVAASGAADDYGWIVTTGAPTPAAPNVAPVGAPVESISAAPVESTSAAPVESASVEPLAPAPPASSGGDVVVVAGDSLWAIAARHLAPDATDAEIAASWPQWYRANATVIGPDPDRIVPGQSLTAPARPDGTSS